MSCWPLTEAKIVAGFRPMAGNAPFAQGAVVLAKDGLYLKVEEYIDTMDARGVELTGEDFRGHLQSCELTELKEQVPAFVGATWWVLRSPQLKARTEIGKVARHTYWDETGACGLLVDEKQARPIRLQWAAEERRLAREKSKIGRFLEAEAHSIAAFCLDIPAPLPETLALCVLTHRWAEHPEASDALWSSIKKSTRRTPDLLQRVQEYVQQYEELPLRKERSSPPGDPANNQRITPHSYQRSSAIKNAFGQLRKAA